MILQNITNTNLFYDNSLKKVISKIKYNNKNIVIKIDNIEIIKLENNILYIKNSKKINKILNLLSKILQERFKIDNCIFQNNLDDTFLKFHCFIKNITFTKNHYYKINIFLSHLESISNKIYCQCYVIDIL